MNFSVTKDGKPFRDYTWDEKTRTFSTQESGIVLDFSGVDGCTFNTSDSCTFTTGDYCIFHTGWDCTFTTGYKCIFKTAGECIFKTAGECTFTTGDGCTFTTGWDCTFKTGKNCVIIRYDVKGVIVLQGKTIKLNGYKIPGYTKVK